MSGKYHVHATPLGSVAATCSLVYAQSLDFSIPKPRPSSFVKQMQHTLCVGHLRDMFRLKVPHRRATR